MRIEFDRRPILVFASGLIVGILAIENWLAIPVGIVFLFLIERRSVAWTYFAAILLGAIIAPKANSVEIPRNSTLDADVTVSRVPVIFDTGIQCIVDIQGQTFAMTMPSECEPHLGDVWRIRGKLQSLSETQEQFYAVRGVNERVKVLSAHKVSDGPWFYALSDKWRRSMLSLTHETMGPETGSLVEALCFNMNGRLSNELSQSLVDSGTIHVIAASGLQVMILAGFIQFAFGLLPLPRWTQLLLLSIVLLSYACSTGLNPPVVRAVIMAILFVSAYMFRREPDVMNSLGLACVAYLLWQPGSVYDLSFQLSSIAVGALGLFYRFNRSAPNTALESLGSQTYDLARGTVIATLGTAPIVAYAFGRISVIGLAANFLVIPFVAPIILLSLVSLMVHPVLPALSMGLMKLGVEPLTAWVKWAVEISASVPFAVLTVPAFSPLWLLAYYVGWILVWRPQVRPVPNNLS